MADGRQRADWARASELLAMTFNVHAKPEEWVSADVFNPFEEDRPSGGSSGRGIPITPDSIGVLKIFVKGEKAVQ